MSDVIGVLKDIVRGMAIFIGGLVGLLVVVVVYLDLTRIPAPDVQLGRVDRDTTFYIGESESDPGGGVAIALLATWLLDKSDASVLIEYTRPPATATDCKLPAGPVDRIYRSDFYDNRAKVTYRHGTVQHGHLRLRIVFGYPPEEWGNHPTKY